MATYIPGAETLGYGFDVLGSFSDQSRISPLFEMQYDSQTWKEYLVPVNASLDTSSKHYGSSNSFESRSKVEEHFAAKLNIKASYGFFSGEFEASYDMDSKSDVEYQYGLVETYSKIYALDLKDKSEHGLAPWVKNDPDYQNIPDTFAHHNRGDFFRFFDKYGIYFISKVVLGSRLYYSTVVSKSHKYTSNEIKTKISIEYNGIFGASAKAEAEWKKVGEDWSSSREVKVSATGGDNSILNVLAPGFNANHEGAYESWLKSAESNPSVIDFTLTSISKIFSGKKAKAVEDALKGYLEHKIFIESKTGSCLINFNGKNVLPPPSGTENFYGYQLAAINRTTLKVELAKSYSTHDYWSGYDAIYDAMQSDITPYNNSGYIIAFTTFTNFALTAPNSGFAAILKNCGADTGLRQWIDTKNSNYKIFSCCALAHINYALVGIPGSTTVYELFERAGSCDTGDPKWPDGTRGWLGQPAPPVGIAVDMYQHMNLAVDTEQLVAHLGVQRRRRSSYYKV